MDYEEYLIDEDFKNAVMTIGNEVIFKMEEICRLYGINKKNTESINSINRHLCGKTTNVDKHGNKVYTADVIGEIHIRDYKEACNRQNTRQITIYVMQVSKLLFDLCHILSYKNKDVNNLTKIFDEAKNLGEFEKMSLNDEPINWLRLETDKFENALATFCEYRKAKVKPTRTEYRRKE